MDEYSLEQFRVFIAVVDSGGFAAAARKLGKAQSVITYSIRRLEEQTGLILFDRSYYRPKLTNAGQVLLPRARMLIDQLEDFHAHAQNFASGIEAAITIVVNEFSDMNGVIRALKTMHATYPSVKVKILLKAFGEDLDTLRNGDAHIGVIPEINTIGNEFEARHLAEHQLVAVASPSHTLSSIEGAIPLSKLRGQTQIVWGRASATLSDKDMGVHSLDTWYVTDLGTKLKLLVSGMGWGSLPKHLVQDEIEQGRLQLLDMESWEGRDTMPIYSTAVVTLRKSALGPAAKLLMQSLLQ